MKTAFTEEDVKRVYAEFERRMRSFYKDGAFEDERDAEEFRRAMRQGIYGTLMVLSSNWSEVSYMFDKVEDENYTDVLTMCTK